MAIRDGFIIPNAATFAPDFQTAQPDQGDFVVLGNSQYGVITGCKVTLSGTTVTIGAGPHLLMVNGEIYSVTANQTVSVSPIGQKARFDLIVYDTSNTTTPFRVVAGTPSDNPVYPEINSTMTVLAAVFVPASGGSGSLRLIDKRNFLQNTLVGLNVPVILKNYGSGGSGVQVEITGNGTIRWGDGSGAHDTTISRTAAGKVTVSNELVAGVITATSAATVAGKGVVTNETIAWGTGAQRDATTPDIGDVWVNNTNGDVSVYRATGAGSNAWTSLQPNIPSGSVICSFLSSQQMTGWLPLIGGDYAVSEAGNLPALFPAWVSSGRIYLPDMRGRFPIGAVTTVNSSYGTLIDDIGTINVGLTVDNLPSHRHQSSSSTTTGLDGLHSHGGSTDPAGGHSHAVGSGGIHSHTAIDTGHSHTWTGGWPIVATMVDWDSCMDIPFGDSSHCHRTKPSLVSEVGAASIVVNQNGAHTHSLDPASNHTHPISATSTHNGHTHSLPEHSSVGGGQPVSFRPPSVSLHFYIKM